ncbi:hypothetical protein NDU88_002182 [Pleurodeles waltl]|uniref:Uncharacterized protein n=1 Tax=Pleurodeles waltl TaxID=8319 RepID=A0AAV7RCL2_PLEWA|nr:hypothetical protein NDU88_002182 [Pleurodeles waltl]
MVVLQTVLETRRDGTAHGEETESRWGFSSSGVPCKSGPLGEMEELILAVAVCPFIGASAWGLFLLDAKRRRPEWL